RLPQIALSSLPAIPPPLGPTGNGTIVIETYIHENSKKGEGGGCAICLEEYKDRERRAVISTCDHRYHEACIEAWLAKHDTCPLCRSHVV
ncbi:putative RING-H2 finger protein atl53, partial [Phtheirospermum japonicum]